MNWSLLLEGGVLKFACGCRVCSERNLEELKWRKQEERYTGVGVFVVPVHSDGSEECDLCVYLHLDHC